MRNWDAIGTVRIVRIRATVTIGTYLLPELVRRYQVNFRRCMQTCRFAAPVRWSSWFLDNRIDLGLIETQPGA